MEKSLILSKENDDQSLSLSVNPERLKYIFHMLHGEATTRTRSLHGAILVTKSDIEQLVDSIIDQLQLSHVREYMINIGVGFEKDIIEKPYDKFKSYNWTEPNKTTEVIIKINFLYEDYDSGNPLKHSMLIRIAKGLKPANIFQLMASNDNEKLDNIETLMCPVFCRTDHINDKLSKDLLNVVQDWHAGQKQPKLLSGAYEFIRSHKRTVARMVHYSFSTAMIFILCYFSFLTPHIFREDLRLPVYVSLIISSKVFISLCLNIGGNRANHVFENLSKISNQDVIFDITKGDDKEHSEIIDTNKLLFKSATATFVWTNIQAIATGILATVIFEAVKAITKT